MKKGPSDNAGRAFRASVIGGRAMAPGASRDDQAVTPLAAST
jgi:hypothetical protein